MRLAQNLVIVGVGLIGGSIGLAARKKGLAGRIIGVGRSEESLRLAQRYRAIDEATTDVAAAAAKADLLVLAAPVSAIVPLAKAAAKRLAPECVVTDVGSTKTAIVRECESLFDGRFVGSHPMAGSEKAGIKYAKETLFNNAVCILTPTIKTKIKTTQKVASFWEHLGAKVKTLKPQEHDAIVSAVSHFPHLLAYLLVLSLKTGKFSPEEALSFAAGGFKDMTRIAASPAELWSDILFENKGELLASVDHFKDLLARAEKLLRDGKKKELTALLEQAKTIRERLG